jgi:hypothetical protein
MKRSLIKAEAFLFIFLLFCAVLSAQDPEKIRFKKESQFIYFFQKQNASSLLVPGKNDLFYLLVPDTLKPFLVISSENAALILQKNDSLVLCKLLPGMRYEHFYRRDEENKFRYKAGVNGASVIAPGEVLIQFTDKRNNAVLFENRVLCPKN